MSWKKHFNKDKIEYSGRWVRNWFSNMSPSEFELDGRTWKSVENYYQAMKSNEFLIQEQIRFASISESKQLGRKIEVREDWEDIKGHVMYRALQAKFNLEPHKSQLLNTGDEILIEWNNWGDKIWGVSIYDQEGQNHLGILLMTLRDELRKEK